MKKTILIWIVIMFAIIANVSAQQAPGISVSLVDYSPRPVQPGQVMDVYIQVENTGSPTASSSLEIVEEYPFILEDSKDRERAKDLGPVSTRQILNFRVRIAQDAKDGIAPLKVIYKIDKTSGGFVEKEFDINIQTFDARLDILSIEQLPEAIEPGENGKLILTIVNNDDKPLENIDVVLDLTNSYDVNTNMNNMLSMQTMINSRLEDISRRVASGLSPLTGPTPMMNGDMKDGEKLKNKFDAIAPIGTSNQKRINVIKPHETIKVIFEIMPLPDIQPNMYAVPVYVSYNDEDNNPFHIRVDIPVKVDMAPDLFVEIKSTTLRTTDFAGTVSFVVANTGLSELRYVTLELEENEELDILTAPRNIYIGTLGPGESKVGNFSVIAHEKNLTFPVKAVYRDSFNRKNEEKKLIPFYIINKNYYRDLPFEMWLVWLILGGVILGLTIFYVKHMNKAREIK